MDNKPKISAKGTYVLDQDDLDKLDELSLTDEVAQLEEVADFLAQELEEDSYGKSTDSLPILQAGADSQDGSIGKSETVESQDDLIAPELLFPELSNDSDDG